MALAQILQCDPSSVSFTPSGQPEITSPETLQSLQTAARHLKSRHPVVFPTETVYGLGALALDSTASSLIFSIKGRPADNPLIVHVSSMQMLHRLIPNNFAIPHSYRVLMSRFWPGSLTLLFPSNPHIVPSIITAQQPTVAVRMPSHPIARALIALTDAPIAAPSANSSGKPSPTVAEHVFSDLGSKISYILDGGPCAVGVESTVIDGLNEDGNIRVLRPGGVTVENIEQALQEDLPTGQRIPQVLVHRRDYHDEVLEAAPTTPGMKYRHYSPSVPVNLLMTTSPPNGVVPRNIHSYLTTLSTTFDTPLPARIGVMFLTDSPLGTYHLPDLNGVEWLHYELGPKSDPSIAARRLFDGLLSLERKGVHIILIEEVDEVKEGLAVMNRVQKAATQSSWVSV
ncbi:translation factor [Marasmius fiardii PR-910]|nr:translation factor [Marasmius fiardii PR-910]